VAALLEISALGLVFDDVDLGGSSGFDVFCLYFSLFYIRSADCGILSVIDEKDLVESDFIALFVGTWKLLDLDGLVLRYLILLSACGDYCYFHSFLIIYKFEKKAR